MSKTKLGKKLKDLRDKAISKGMQLLSEDEILKEVKRRRAEEINSEPKEPVGIPEKPDYRKMVTYRTVGKYGTFWGARIICTCIEPQKQKLCRWYKPHSKAGQGYYYSWCRYSYDNNDVITDACMGGLSFGPLPKEAPDE